MSVVTTFYKSAIINNATQRRFTRVHQVHDEQTGAEISVWKDWVRQVFMISAYIEEIVIEMEYPCADYPGINQIIQNVREWYMDWLREETREEEEVEDSDCSISINSEDSATTIDSQDSAYDPTWLPEEVREKVDADDWDEELSE